MTYPRVTVGRYSSAMVAELGLETGGSRRRRPPTTAQIVRMIRSLVARRLEQMMETPMGDGEEEQKLLEIISRTTGKLEDLARERKIGGKPPRRSSKALAELRRQIADRIEQLNQG